MRKLKKKYTSPKSHLVVNTDLSLKRKMYKDIRKFTCTHTKATQISEKKNSDMGVKIGYHKNVQLVGAIQ